MSAPTLPPPDAFAAAREVQWLWKTDAMRRMARALVECAVQLPEFAADDLPADLEHGGSGIAGSVTAVLVNRGLIQRAGFWRGQDFYGKERVSRRPGRKDAKLKVFTLANLAQCEAFLGADQRVRELHQPGLL
jgi:hypothetical protein